MAAGHFNENALLARRLNTRKADRQIANSEFVSTHYQFCARHTTTQTHCSSHSLSLRSSFKTPWSSWFVFTYNPSYAGLRTMLDALKLLATVSPDRLNIFTAKTFPVSVSVSYSHHLITWIVIKGDSLNCVVDPPSLSGIQGRAIRCDQLGVAPDVWSQWVTGNLSFLLYWTDEAVHQKLLCCPGSPISFLSEEFSMFSLVYIFRCCNEFFLCIHRS